MYAKKNSGKKVVATLLAIALLIGGVVGGTVAYLVANTQTVTNTFTVGDINIDLKETVDGTSQSALNTAVTNDKFHIVPGNKETKDPTITVEANSEDCYVFVEITESNITKDGVTYVTWTIDDDWTAVPNKTNVYYQEYTGVAAKDYTVLKNNEVSYPSTLTKAQLDDLGTATPSLVFTAYAVQKANGDTTFTPEQAWNIAKGLNP